MTKDTGIFQVKLSVYDEAKKHIGYRIFRV